MRRIDDLRRKIELFTTLDHAYQTERQGSSLYRLKAPLPEAHVVAFEDRYRIRVPADYRAFITTIGDGEVPINRYVTYTGTPSLGDIERTMLVNHDRHNTPQPPVDKYPWLKNCMWPYSDLAGL